MTLQYTPNKISKTTDDIKPQGVKLCTHSSAIFMSSGNILMKHDDLLPPSIPHSTSQDPTDTDKPLYSVFTNTSTGERFRVKHILNK